MVDWVTALPTLDGMTKNRKNINPKEEQSRMKIFFFCSMMRNKTKKTMPHLYFTSKAIALSLSHSILLFFLSIFQCKTNFFINVRQNVPSTRDEK